MILILRSEPRTIGHRMSDTFNKARLIGAVVLVALGALESFAKNLDAKNLRRLRQHQMFARQR